MTASAWFEANAALIPHQIAGLVLLGVGAWLLGFHGRVASSRHFGGFLVGYGAAVVLSSIATSDAGMATVLRSTASTAFFYCTFALLLCVLSFPRSVLVAVDSVWVTLVPAGVAVLAAAVIVAAADPGAGFAYATGIGNAVIACAVAVAFVRLGREPPGAARRSLFLLAVGLSLQETYFTTFGVAAVLFESSPGPHDMLVLWGNATALLILAAGAVSLLRRTRAAEPEKARLARGVLFTIPVAAGTGFLSALFAANPWVVNLGSLWRLLFAGLVTWGILRHQFLGVDVKVRWGISRSTIAAAFVAVFFVASEGAQIVFGSEDPWVGLFAAGALVFAIAPLQRAAERLAEKAVPVETAPGSADLRREEVYRQALRIALTDREVSRAEDLHLFRLAEEMGIQAGRAMEMRQEIEAERQEAGR